MLQWLDIRQLYRQAIYLRLGNWSKVFTGYEPYSLVRSVAGLALCSFKLPQQQTPHIVRAKKSPFRSPVPPNSAQTSYANLATHVSKMHFLSCCEENAGGAIYQLPCLSLYVTMHCSSASFAAKCACACCNDKFDGQRCLLANVPRFCLTLPSLLSITVTLLMLLKT